MRIIDVNGKPKRIYHQSDLNSFDMCAYRWYLEEVEYKRRKGNFYSCRGNGWHKGRQVNFAQKIESGTDLPVDDLIDGARMEINRLVVEIEEVDLNSPELKGMSAHAAAGKILDSTIPMIKHDWNLLQPKIQPAYVEKFLQVNLLDYPFGLGGYIDLIDKNDWLIDGKTISKKPTKISCSAIQQGCTYNLLATAYLGYEPRGVEFQYLYQTKKGCGIVQMPPFIPTPEDIQIVMQRYSLMHSAIEAGIFPPADKNAWVCSENWCSHWRECKYAYRQIDNYERRI